MIFWDSSAVGALLMSEPDSELREQSLREDSDMLVWYATPVELESALNRRRRERQLSAKEEKYARARFDALAECWIEIQPTTAVRERALRLLRVHPLRAADAFQLAAALIACREQTRGFGFCTADRRLSEAAAAEGFRVL